MASVEKGISDKSAGLTALFGQSPPQRFAPLSIAQVKMLNGG